MTVMAVPDYTKHVFLYDAADRTAPTALSAADSFRLLGKMLSNRPGGASDPVPHRVTQVTVTLFHNGEAPQVEAEGVRLTKSLDRDKRHTYSTIVVLNEELAAEYLTAAQAVMAR